MRPNYNDGPIGNHRGLLCQLAASQSADYKAFKPDSLSNEWKHGVCPHLELLACKFFQICIMLIELLHESAVVCPWQQLLN